MHKPLPPPPPPDKGMPLVPVVITIIIKNDAELNRAFTLHKYGLEFAENM